MTEVMGAIAAMWRTGTGSVWRSGCPCGAGAGPVCQACTDALIRGPLLHRLLPDGTPCVSSTAYRGPVRSLVMAAKEGGRRDVRDVLAHSLARALAEVGWGGDRRSAALLVVPPPTTMSTRWRRRGDPVAELAWSAGRLIHRSGAAVDVVALLHGRRRVRDQSGLGAGARWNNLDGAFRARPPDRSHAVADVVVVDDVLTTGATATEAVAALRVAGWRVIGVATVASAVRAPQGGPIGRSVPAGGHDTP